MDMVKVDIQKLQLLNERIGQTLEALEQVRSSVQGLQHSAAPQTWNAQPFVAPPPFGPYQQQPQHQQNPFAQAFNPYVPFQAYAFHNDPRQSDPRQYNQPQYDPRQYSPQQYSPQPYGQPQYNQQFNQPQYGQPQYGQPQYGQPQFNQPPYAPPPYAVRVQPPTNGLSHTAWDPSWQRLAWDPTVRPFTIS